MISSATNVFVNCPFDDDFDENFRALVFAVTACGFRARCAREMDDGAETRIDKIYRIIGESRYSVHDLSRTELDPHHSLPRFNMPLELGIFLGAKQFGAAQHTKKQCIILDTTPYRYQKFISDISGMDIRTHNNNVPQLLEHVRGFLRTVSHRIAIPAPLVLTENYEAFTSALPRLAARSGFDSANLLFPDLERFILSWLRSYAIKDIPKLASDPG